MGNISASMCLAADKECSGLRKSLYKYIYEFLDLQLGPGEGACHALTLVDFAWRWFCQELTGSAKAEALEVVLLVLTWHLPFAAAERLRVSEKGEKLHWSYNTDK